MIKPAKKWYQEYQEQRGEEKGWNFNTPEKNLTLDETFPVRWIRSIQDDVVDYLTPGPVKTLKEYMDESGIKFSSAYIETQFYLVLAKVQADATTTNSKNSPSLDSYKKPVAPITMDKFLHNHPDMEEILHRHYGTMDHVVVDITDWESARDTHEKMKHQASPGTGLGIYSGNEEITMKQQVVFDKNIIEEARSWVDWAMRNSSLDNQMPECTMAVISIMKNNLDAKLSQRVNELSHKRIAIEAELYKDITLTKELLTQLESI